MNAMPKNNDDDIPQLVKDLYNDHLAYTRAFHRKPFKLRQNFKGFKEDDRYRNYHQLAIWLDRHKEINRQMFFEAYLYFHKERQAIPIKYYIHPNALTYYTKYRKVIESMDLSSTLILKSAIKSFEFIYKYIVEQGIELTDYLDFREEGSVERNWLQHVKNGNVNLYVLFSLGDVFNILKSLYKDVDVWNFYLSEESTPYLYLRRWNNSDKFQTLTQKAKSKIKAKEKERK